VKLIILIFYRIDDDVTDNIKKMSLIVDMSCIEWMVEWISCMSKELH
jgi:hypothetical protein